MRRNNECLSLNLKIFEGDGKLFFLKQKLYSFLIWTLAIFALTEIPVFPILPFFCSWKMCIYRWTEEKTEIYVPFQQNILISRKILWAAVYLLKRRPKAIFTHNSLVKFENLFSKPWRCFNFTPKIMKYVATFTFSANSKKKVQRRFTFFVRLRDRPGVL